MPHPRLLLIQIRDDAGVRVEEVESFARHAGLSVDHITVLNVFDTPDFEPSLGRGFDGVLVGGASEASVLEPDRFPFVPRIVDLLRDCVDARVPTFASCFGFQAAVIGLGGTIVRDAADFEMGTIPMNLTPEAAEDVLFGDVTDGFLAVSCHRERATDWPAGVVPLAFSPACPHAFRVAGAPLWTFQFHPELDRQRFIERLGIFRGSYTDHDDHYARTIARFAETPESNRLVRRFVERVIGG